MKKLLLFALSLVVFLWNARSQDASEKFVSSPEKHLAQGKLYLNDPEKIDSAKLAFDTAIRLADSQGNVKCKIDGLIQLSTFFLHQSLVDSAVFQLQEAIQFSKANQNILLGDIYQSLGVAFYRTDNKDKSFQSFLVASKIFEKEKDLNKLALAYCQLADLAEIFGRYDVSQNFKSKAIHTLPLVDDPVYMVDACNYLSSTYLFTRHLDSTFLDSCFYYGDRARLIAESQPHMEMKMNAIFNVMSDYYLVKNEFDQAISWNLKAIPYRKYLAKGAIVMYYSKMVDCYQQKGFYDQVLIYLDSVKQVLPQIKSNYYQLYYHNRMYECTKAMQDYRTALENYETFKVLEDSIYSIQRTNTVNELAQKYEKAEDEKKILELNNAQQKSKLAIQTLLFVVFGVLLILLLIFMYYRQRAFRQQKKIIDTEMRLNRARLDPHFFFNTLSSIQTLSETDQQKTSGMLGKLARVMRKSLESTYRELVTIEEEIEFLTAYLDFQQLRYPGRFDYEIKSDNNLALNELYLPGMILQPLVENSIEHGFKKIPYPGKLTVEIQESEDYLVILIQDNGVTAGNHLVDKEFPSRATQIVKDSLFLLELQYKKETSFERLPNLDERGFSVKIKIPAIYAKSN